MCAPERMLRPMTSTSSWSAASTIIWGVWRMPGVDDVHAGVPERAGDYLGASVMSVQAGLGDKDADRVLGGHGSYLRAVSASTSSISTPRVALGCMKPIMPDSPSRGRGVNEPDSALSQRVEAFLEVLHLEADVVDALAPALDESGHAAVRVGGLDELKLRAADADEGGADGLVFYVLHLGLAGAEHVAVEGEGILDVVDGDADVVYVSRFAGGWLENPRST